MPQSGRKRVFKIQFKRSDIDEESSEKSGSVPLKAKGVGNIRSVSSSFDKSSATKQPSLLLRKVFGKRSQKVRMVGGVPEKSKLNPFSDELLKSRKANIDKLPGRNASLLNKKLSSSNLVSKSLMQKEYASPRFMSILIGKGRIIKHKVIDQLFGRKVWQENERVARLPHAKRLQLFQALLKEPLPFLELHVRFGVSKQTIRRLVKNGLLIEEWGPKAIGVKFKLSKKGKIYLEKLEATARYESKLTEKEFIRLKQKSLV